MSKEEEDTDSAVDKGWRLIHLPHTWLDIAYEVIIVSQFMHATKEKQWRAIHRILHYLKATPGIEILFKGGEEINLEAQQMLYASSLVNKKIYIRLLYLP